MLEWILLVVCIVLFIWLWRSGKFINTGTPVRHACSTCPNKKFDDIE